MSRRGLLGAGVLAGVLAASGVPLQARTRGGVLRLALAQPLPHGNWSRAPAVLAQGAVYDTLLEIGPTGELAGELATVWETEPGARRWHLVLRPDAVFHDNAPLRAEDVLASLARHRQGPSAWTLANVAGLEPQGSRAVLITLHEGDPDFPFTLTDPRLIVGPKGHLDGTGTGLYRVAEPQEPDRLRLERVAAHWKDGRAGWFDAVEAVRLPSPASRLEALLGGEVDVVDPLPADLAQVALEAGMAVTAVQGNRQLHAHPPPGLGPALLSRALDRDALALAWGGAPAADHPLGPLHPAFSVLPPPAFDPEAAATLEAALEFRFWAGRPTEAATFEKALAGPWAPLGDDLSLRRLLAAARAAQEPERLALYAEAQTLCAKAAPVVVAAHVPALTVCTPRLVHGGAVSPHGSLDGGRLPERWWFA
jgi:peptide/nickel transport system substrate-binding protein